MIEITKDYEMIRKMLFEDKELFERISDDYTGIADIKLEDSEWVGFFDSGDCLGLLSVHEETASVINIHIHIPKKHRGKNSFEIGNGLLDHAINNCEKRIIKINAKIPVLYPDVIRFAGKCGFEVEGLDKSSFMKNGKIYDKVCMGRVINNGRR